MHSQWSRRRGAGDSTGVVEALPCGRLRAAVRTAMRSICSCVRLGSLNFAPTERKNRGWPLIAFNTCVTASGVARNIFRGEGVLYAAGKSRSKNEATVPKQYLSHFTLDVSFAVHLYGN